MKKKIKIIIGVFLFFICSMNVYADEVCESSELARLRKLAEKVDFSYDYEIKEYKSEDGRLLKIVEYTIEAINLNDEINVKVLDDSYGKDSRKFKKQKNNTATVGKYYDGDKVKISIEAYVKNDCSGESLLTKTIKLPYYNYYIDNKICQYHDYCDACVQFVEKKLSEDQFVDMINKCEKIKFAPNTDKEQGSNDGFDKYLYYYIGGGVFLVVIVTIVGIVLFKKKRKRLI